jgi:hypothetical protein
LSDSGVTCLPHDSCELELYKFNLVFWSNRKQTTSPYHQKVTSPGHDMAEKMFYLALDNSWHGWKNVSLDTGQPMT